MRLRFFAVPALLAAAPLAAQTPVAPAPDIPTRQAPTIVAEPVALAIAGFDADQDGIVTRAELSTGAARSFASVAKGAADVGYIGYSDWALRWLGDANALPNPFEVDGDRNNRITAVELTTALTADFDRFDKDRDGRLTRAELVTVRASMFGSDRRPRDRDRRPPAK